MRKTAAFTIALLFLMSPFVVQAEHNGFEDSDIDSATALDTDEDGHFDAYQIRFGSAVDPSRVHANEFFVAHEFKENTWVAGIDVTATGDEGRDYIVEFPERFTPDTATLPELEYRQNGRDPVTPTLIDGMKPVALSVYAAKDSTDTAVVQFSEGINYETGGICTIEDVVDHITVTRGQDELDIDSTDFTNGDRSLDITLDTAVWEIGDIVAFTSDISGACNTTLEDDEGNLIVDGTQSDFHDPVIEAVRGIHGSDQVQVRFSTPVRNSNDNAVGPANLDVVDDSPVRNVGSVASCLDCFVLQLTMSGNPNGKLDHDAHLGTAKIDVDGLDVHATDGEAYGSTPVAITDDSDPTVLTASGVQGDAGIKGVVTEVWISFSEPINTTGDINNSVDDWSVTGWTDGIASVVGQISDPPDNPDSDRWTQIKLVRQNPPAAAQENSSAPLTGLDYTGNDITDRSGNPLATFTDFGVQDEVRPVLIEAVTEDSDGDGLLDGYNLTFSEPIDDATFDCSAWTVSGHTVEATGCFTLWDEADQRHKGTLAFSEGSSFDTGVTPRLQATSGAVADFAGNNLRPADTQADDPEPTDGAVPVFVEAVGTIGSQSVILRFSEAVDGSTGDGLQSGDFSYDNENGGGATGIASIDHENGHATATMTVTGSVIGSDFDTDEITFKGTATAANNTDHAVEEAILFLTGSDERFDVVSITTVDGGGSDSDPDSELNGLIDHLNITFDSPIKDSTFDHTKWDVAGYTVTGKYTDGTSNDRYMHLKLEEDPESGGDTGATPNVQYSGGGLLNESNVALADIDMDAEDGAAPVIMEAIGNVGADTVTARFSEPVKRIVGGDDQSLKQQNFLYDNTETGDHREQHITDGVSHSVCTDEAVLPLNATLKEGDVGDNLVDADTVAPRDSVRDCSPSQHRAVTSISAPVEDLVAPTFSTGDVETVGDGEGNITKLRVIFNEALDDPTTSDAGDWSLDLKDGGSAKVPEDIEWNQAMPKELMLVIKSGQRPSDTGVRPIVEYTQPEGGVNITDVSGNPLASTGPVTAVDKVAPVLRSAETQDLNGNGQIDQYRFEFSEKIDDSSFNLNHWEITGYDEIGFSTGQDVDDRFIRIDFQESGAADSGARPAIEYDPGLADGVVDMSVEGNPLAPIESVPDRKDGASPVIIELDAVAGRDDLQLTFSEPVVELDEAGSDFDYEDGNGEGAQHLSSSEGPVNKVSPTRYDVILDADLVSGDLDADCLDPQSTIVDGAGNGNSQGCIALSGVVFTDPPGAIENLAVDTVGLTEVTLNWGRPSGDDLEEYDLRYSNETIDSDGDFNGATKVTSGVPSPSGSTPHSATVTGLEEETTYHFAIKTINVHGQTSPLSNPVSATTEAPDETPPGAIRNLVVLEDQLGADRARLQWTATGDDGHVGRVDTYQVKVSTSQITTNNFANIDDATVAFLVGGESGIAIANQTQTAIVSGLDSGTTYFLRLRGVDSSGNTGPISDQVEFTTVDDDTPPTGTLVVSSSTHDDPSVATTGIFSFSGLSDPESDITYRYVRDQSSNTEVTLASTAASGTTLTLSNLPVGEHFLHVRGFSAGGPSNTVHFEFEVVETLSDEVMQAANDALEYSVTWDGEKNTIRWTLPGDPPMQITGVQIYRADSPYTLVETVQRGSADFGDGSYVDDSENATADSTYLLQLVFRGGQSVFSGQGSDVPDTQAFAGIQPTQETDGTDGDDGGTGGEDDGVPPWVWIVLAVVGASILIVIIVAIVASSRRSRAEEEEELVTAEREDDGYVWPEEEGAAAAAASGEAPPDEPEHHLECPNCSHRFVAHGEKPLTTTCPNCGKKGTLS